MVKEHFIDPIAEERAAIAAEARRRALALRAMKSWPEASGGAGALEKLAEWIEERK